MKDALFAEINHAKARELRLLAYTWLTVLLNVVIIITIGSVSAFYGTIALACTSVGIHLIHFRRADFFVSCISACLTPLFDITAHTFDLWQFSSQDFLGIPYWLPFMYMVSSLVILRLKEVVSEER